jgi:hypothetical protein
LKTLLAPFAIAIALFGETIAIKEAPNQTNFYTIAPIARDRNASAKGYAPDRAQFSKPNRYYLFGDPNLEKISTGYIAVGFEIEPDITAFSERYNLKNPRKINRKFCAWIFENGGAIDDLSVAAQIGANEPNIRYAKPVWKSTFAPQ